MALDPAKLHNVFERDGRTIAQCPACAENDADKKGEHLLIYLDGRFACVLNPGPEGAAHRARIFQLAGLQDAKPNGVRARCRRKQWQTLDQASAAISAKLRMRETRRDIYRSADGGEHFAVIRFDNEYDKEYRPFHRNGSGWLIGDAPSPLTLFNLPDLRARLTGPVFVVEGEKCACELGTLELLATTSAHGAQSAHKSDWTPLAGRDVVLLPDNDDDGRTYVLSVAGIISTLSPPARVRIVELPDLPVKGDAVDWLEKHDAQLPEDILAELETIVSTASTWTRELEKPSVSQELPPENDAGNASLFLDRFDGELRFVPAFKCWLTWTGTRWKRDEDGGIQRFAVRLSQLLMSDAAQIVDHTQRTTTAQRGIRLGNAATINSMMELAKCDERVVVRHSKLDSDPWLLGVENGVIELQTGTFRNGRKEDLITKTAGCAYDSKADAPRWRQFLQEIFLSDDELIAYVQKLVGYTLTGITREQMFPFLHGEGANGKTTFIETITALLGDYGQRAPQTLLIACHNGREPINEIARLHGARFVVGSETREGERLAENRIKDMTGGDMLTGRFLYREAFDFIPTLKLWMFGNHRPQIRGTDWGIWRRVQLIPFNVQIADRERDRSLQEKLRHELPGILNWAVQGCLLWQQDGLKAPDTVKTATAEYREDEDVLYDFLAEETEPDNESRVPHSEVYKRYSDWCGQNGVRVPTQSRTFSKRLSDRGYRRERTGKGVRWAGIKLK